MTPYQSEDPSPTLPTYRGTDEKEKIVEDKKKDQLGQQKGIGPALETRQSHTIEYGVKVKVKFSMARILPVENLLPQNVGSIINYL